MSKTKKIQGISGSQKLEKFLKPVFWNVDTQYDFMRNDENFKGALPVPEARSIESNLEKLTGLAREKDITVVNTADWHNMNSEEFSQTPDFKTTFPPHCLQGTKGAEFVPATKPRDNAYVIDWQDKTLDKEALAVHKGDLIIYKDKFGVFDGNPHTNDVLEILQPKKAVVYGVATNVCVNFAVLGLLERGVDVYVPTDAIKELPGLPSPLEIWKEKGAVLTTVNEVVKYL